MTVGELRQELALLDSSIEVRFVMAYERYGWQILNARVERVESYWIESRKELFLLGGDEKSC